MLRRTAHLLLVAALMFSIGLHWAVLQGMAWTGMFIAFARDGAVIEAVEKTFDGQHGCPLCEKVKEGRESGEKQPAQVGQSLKKIDAVLTDTSPLIPPAHETMSFAMIREESVKRNERPEMPPPRLGLA